MAAHFRTYALAGIVALAFAAPLHASDHLNLEPNLPITVEDAYPIAVGGREVQAFARYEKTGEHQDRLTLEPRFEFGILPNTQLSVESPFEFGPGDKAGSGDVSVEAFYNFNQEALWLPAFAGSVRIETPTGVDSAGVDTELKFIATKTIDPEHLGRAHLNLSWIHNAAPQDDERHDRYALVVGYSFRLTPDAILIADFVRQSGRLDGSDESLLELGVRWQLTPQIVVGLGVGAGVGDDSPDFRITPCFQCTF